MPDDKEKIKPHDSTRVNIHEEYELHYWAERFNVKREELIKAVNAVGDSASRIEDYLNEHKRK